MTDHAQHHDPTGQPLADPRTPATPEESALLDGFRNQPVDSQARPDTSVLDALKVQSDALTGEDR